MKNQNQKCRDFYYKKDLSYRNLRSANKKLRK